MQLLGTSVECRMQMKFCCYLRSTAFIEKIILLTWYNAARYILAYSCELSVDSRGINRSKRLWGKYIYDKNSNVIIIDLWALNPNQVIYNNLIAWSNQLTQRHIQPSHWRTSDRILCLTDAPYTYISIPQHDSLTVNVYSYGISLWISMPWRWMFVPLVRW